MRQNYIPKSEIIGSTDRNSEAGLDAYDSGNEEQQRVILMLIKILCIFNEAIQNHGSFCQMMNE